jgi:hypothetical protein
MTPRIWPVACGWLGARGAVSCPAPGSPAAAPDQPRAAPSLRVLARRRRVNPGPTRPHGAGEHGVSDAAHRVGVRAALVTSSHLPNSARPPNTTASEIAVTSVIVTQCRHSHPTGGGSATCGRIRDCDSSALYRGARCIGSPHLFTVSGRSRRTRPPRRALPTGYALAATASRTPHPAPPAPARQRSAGSAVGSAG